MTDLRHATTLGLCIMEAFGAVAPRYGLRLEGIDDDANEHSMFWQEVGRELLNAHPQHRDATDE